MSVPVSNTGDEALYLAQLICTRLCHDLAGPVGAVAAGVELAGDDPTQIDAETLGLIGSSSAAASQKLKFLRAALGQPHGAAAGNLRILLDGYLEAVASRGIAPEVRWATDQELTALSQRLGVATAPLILNLCLLVMEALPVCRKLELHIAPAPGMRIMVAGHGDPQKTAAWRPDIVAAAAAPQATELSAKTIQPQIAHRIAASAGGRIVLDAAPNILRAAFEVTF